MAALLLFAAGCATDPAPEASRRRPGYDPARAERLAVRLAAEEDGVAGVVEGFGVSEQAPAEQSAGEQAAAELHCVLPLALSSPESYRAPREELGAFMESVAAGAAPSAERPDLVAEVEAGRRAVANAAWWGFDSEDATAAIQAAVDSPAAAVVIPAMEEPWRVSPLTLRADLVLLLEEGTEVIAKRGEFIERNATVFSVRRAENIIIWGYGATVRMRKSDYSSWPYAESEYRHALRFRSVANLGIYGLRVEEAGGDGIYIGRSGDEKPYSENVVIRDVHLDRGNRQGLSVISVRGMLIEGSTFSNTAGTLPQAGIDFEPNKPDEYLEDIVVRDSLFFRNRGAGIQFFLWNMTDDSPPISVRIEGSELRGNLLDFYVARAGGTPTGGITVADSRIGWRRWVRTPPGLEVVYE
ncbi:MAG: right-handed parallel beta-helix repeat-containing protein [Spirochaetaceae bacterium]